MRRRRRRNTLHSAPAKASGQPNTIVCCRVVTHAMYQRGDRADFARGWRLLARNNQRSEKHLCSLSSSRRTFVLRIMSANVNRVITRQCNIIVSALRHQPCAVLLAASAALASAAAAWGDGTLQHVRVGPQSPLHAAATTTGVQTYTCLAAMYGVLVGVDRRQT